MKKINITAVATIISLSIFGGQWVDPETGLNWTYTVSDGKVGIGSPHWDGTAIPTNASGRIIIPDQIEGLPVTTLKPMAFCKCVGLSEVCIPSSVERIGAFAFSECTGLKHISIPAGVRRIDRWAFFGCTNLGAIEFAGALQELPEYVFGGCIALRSVTIPHGTGNIGPRAFFSCDNLEHVYLPNSLTNVSNDAFGYCYKIRDVVMPGEIGRVEELFPHSFGSIATIEITSGSKAVEGYFFTGCQSLERIYIPASVEQIGDRALIRCTSLTNITVAADNLFYFAEDGMLYDRNCNTMITCAAGKAGMATVRDGVSYLGTEAFAGCEKLTEIILPDTLMDIPYGAFQDCATLECLSVPEGVGRIGMYAFMNCRALSQINIPGTVTRIGGGAFTCCDSLEGYWQDGLLMIDNVVVDFEYGLSGDIVIPHGCRMLADGAFFWGSEIDTIDIPSSVTRIGDDAFAYCKKLTAVMFHGNAPTVSGIWNDDRTAIYRGSSNVTNFIYRTASGWKSEDGDFITAWPTADDSARPVVVLETPSEEHPLSAFCDYVVTSSADSGKGSLRYALANVQDGAVILFDLPDEGNNSIILDSPLVLPENRFPEKGLTIGGDNGGRKIAIKGNGTFQLLKVLKGNKVNVDGVVFEGGKGNFGGAIENCGALTVRNCAFSQNESPSWGGAICNILADSLYVQNCDFFENRCGAWGGAIASHTTPLTTILGCRFSSNVCEAWGGAIAAFSKGDTLVINCDVRGNQSYGGAVVAQDGARITLIGSQFAENEAIYKGSDVFNFENCTINAIGSYCKDIYGKISGTTDLPILPTSLCSVDMRAVGGWYSQVKGASGSLALQLNANAQPGFAAKESGKPVFELADEDYVTMKIDNVKPLLYYGLGWSDTPSGDFTVESGLWVQADENGNLPIDVKAPKGNGAARFFRIKVTDDPLIAK